MANAVVAIILKLNVGVKMIIKKAESSDVEEFEQEWNQDRVQGALDTWVNHWSKGMEWGIVGGHGDKSGSTPNTVLEQAEKHGEPEQSRKGTTTFVGLGELVVSIQKLLSGDITMKEITAFEKAVIDLKEVLNDPAKNPANIPFNTIVEFAETDDPKKPKVTKKEVFGHYRTQAYNDYMEWDNTENGATHKIAATDSNWWNKNENKAKPPLLMCISSRQTGIMNVVKEAKKALGPKGSKVKQKQGTIATFRVRSRPGELSKISTMKEHVKSILNDQSIYPKGAQRAPVKQRLNDAFNEKVYSVTSANDIRILQELVIGFENKPGTAKTKQFRLSFPPSNISLNKLIRETLGDELGTFQKPGTTPDTHSPGLTLKMDKSWEGVLIR